MTRSILMLLLFILLSGCVDDIERFMHPTPVAAAAGVVR